MIEIVASKTSSMRRIFLKNVKNSSVNIWKFLNIQNINWSSSWARRPPMIKTRQHRDRQERLRNKRSIDERKSFCTCPPSGNQVDGLPLPPRWPFSGRACIYETRRVFSSSDEVCYAKVLGIQILMILRLRFQLVDARNDRTVTKSIPLKFLKKWKVRGRKFKFHKI